MSNIIFTFHCLKINLKPFKCLILLEFLIHLYLFDKDILSSLSSTFPDFETSLVDNIEANAIVKNFKDGELLIRTGQNIRSTGLVVNGLLKVYREDEEGNEFFMYYLQLGQACALSMVCATKQETSQLMAKATADSEVIMIPLEFMDKWMGQYKTWYQFVVETYRARFEELLITIDHFAFRNMDELLEFYLKRYKETLKSNIIPIAHQEIVNELNS
jgi:CRP/FNR family transcriptional regulator